MQIYFCLLIQRCVQLFPPVVFIHSKAVGRNNFAYRVSGFWRRTQSERKVTPYHVRIESTTLQCQGIFPRSQDYSIPNRSYRPYFRKCIFWHLHQHTFFALLVWTFSYSSNQYQLKIASLLTIRCYWFETYCTFRSALYRQSLKTIRTNVRNKIGLYGIYLSRGLIAFLLICWHLHTR